MRFIVDGQTSATIDCTPGLNATTLYPAVCMYYVNHKLTMIPFDELKNRSGDAGKLVKEYEEFKKDPKNKTKKLDAKSKAIRNMVAKIVDSAESALSKFGKNDGDDDENENEERVVVADGSLITNRETRASQLAVMQLEIKTAVSMKAYIETLDKNELRALLLAKNVSENVAIAIHSEGYSGAEFVLSSFVADALEEDENVQKKYGIKKLHMKSFLKVREALME
jgi:hypothetical protein